MYIPILPTSKIKWIKKKISLNVKEKRLLQVKQTSGKIWKKTRIFLSKYLDLIKLKSCPKIILNNNNNNKANNTITLTKYEKHDWTDKI